jgi:hypothetical protein
MGKSAVPVMPDWGPYPNQITHGVDGFLYNESRELADCLETLRDDAVRNVMAEAAFTTAQDFLIDNQIGQWERVYRGGWPHDPT